MVMGELTQRTELLVIGSGPGGYAAAVRAAELGLEVTLVDASGRPGGVCLFSGCIPSKILLHLTSLIGDAERAAAMGVRFARPQIELEAMRSWKRQVIETLVRGMAQMIERRGIQLLHGRARFEKSGTVRLQGADISRIAFKHCIVATGSQSVRMTGMPATASGRILNPAGALALAQVPSSLLVIGAGATGLELGTIYAGLGSRVVLVEQRARILPNVEHDLTAPLERRLAGLFDEIYVNCKAVDLQDGEQGVQATFEGPGPDRAPTYDQVLVAVGRTPDSDNLGLEHTGVQLDARGFILVDDRQQTHDERICAVGDVTGGLLLAHKAMRQGKVAAETIAGRPSGFDVQAVPTVIYTDPQIAWCGLDETQARQEKRSVHIRRFDWAQSDRAATLGFADGLTKLVADPQSGRILGVGVCGRHAEDLIAEGALAVEMGALVEDLALTLHPYPTLSETQATAADLFEGATDD
jgi:dihydrolipoamide dehydrogenase